MLKYEVDIRLEARTVPMFGWSKWVLMYLLLMHLQGYQCSIKLFTSSFFERWVSSISHYFSSLNIHPRCRISQLICFIAQLYDNNLCIVQAFVETMGLSTLKQERRRLGLELEAFDESNG